MADLNILRQIEQQTGQTFIQLEVEEFKEKVDMGFEKPYAYALSPQNKVICLSLGTLYIQGIHDLKINRFHEISILYLYKMDVKNFSFLSDLPKLDQLYIIRCYGSDFQSLKNLKGFTSLDLSSNNICDISFLKYLKDLTSLDLSNNNISDISFLRCLNSLTSLKLNRNKRIFFPFSKKDPKSFTSLQWRNSNTSNILFLKDLKSLTSLDLSDNEIIDISFLKDLKSLTSLDLSDNEIIDISFLKDLKSLTSLDLSGNNIRNISFLKNLSSLTSLNLRNIENNVSFVKKLTFIDSNWHMGISFSVLKFLKGLTSLDLRGNNIRNISFLKNLNSLTSLSLNNNKISDISCLKNLNSLTFIDLRLNKISDISFLKNLNSLTLLSLSDNKISDISSLKNLNSLTHLNLANNKISDISSLKNLNSLTHLNLANNIISNFSFLKDLNLLTAIDLSANKISDFSFLKDLNSLTILDLVSNNMSDISFLKDLDLLTTIDLSDNKISDISSLENLNNLTRLALANNFIKKIPQWLTNSVMEILVDSRFKTYDCNLYGNPLQEPPLEVVKQGKAAICNYFAQLDTQGKDYLYEAKMLIVGEGEAGKTTLSHKIQDPTCALPHIDDQTKGITVQPHHFSIPDKTDRIPRPFQLNIWDFGGQEIYHYTHRFFLSKRSLYILVADNRKDDTDFNYWLNIIELFAGDSPIMVVLNEKGDIKRNLNRADLRSRFSDSLKDIQSVNFKTQEETDTFKRTQRLSDIRNLINTIEFQAANLPHIGEPIPARWVDVRQAIETDPRYHIYLEQFEELCQAQNISNDQDITVLLSYFHDLGIVLHFKDNPFLRNRVILKPTWATQAVYRIFDHDDIKAKQGRFTRQDCAQIWHDPQYRNMQDVLIELMKNFQLIYEIGTTGNLVAPQMLPSNAPNYPWANEHNSRMEFRYDLFMPKGIFWIFVVNMYRYIVNHDWVWRNGVILEREGTRAEIIENLFERRIYLRFVGPGISEFRAIITDELDQISQTFHKLKYEKMIPCNCKYCVDTLDPHFYEYSNLKKRLDDGRNTVECPKKYYNVPISLLLLGLDRPPIQDPPVKPPPEILIQQKIDNKKIKIFLASSSELKEDRREFEIFINRKNKEYHEQGVFLELNLWEDFLDAMSSTRLQDEYNKVVQSCDIFVSLFHTKVGKYTEEEFQKAFKTFKEDGKPLIFTYFKNAAINPGDITDSILSLLNFKKMLNTLGHFHTNYQDINDLKFQFGNQLTKLLPRFTQTNT
jgi:internalin A